MQRARLAQVELFFDIRGAGPRLVFLSGTGSDLRKPPSPFDRLLDQHFEVLRFDPRGMGQSDKPDLPYSMADYANDAAALMAHVGWSQAAILGYSFGGMVAQEFALRHASSVTRLALVATTAGGAGGASYPLHTLSGLDLEARARRMVELSDVRRDAAWQAAHPALLAAMVEETLAGLRLGANEPGHAIGAARQLEARRGHDTFERLTGLALPVAVFGGEHDGIASPAAVTAMAGKIPGAGLQMFEGGHLFHLQNRAAGEAIVAWLSAAQSS